MEFIPTVEGTILVGWMTYWIVERLAQELGAWLEATPDAYLSINVPPELWGRGGVTYALSKSELAKNIDRVVLEVTERGVPDKLGVDTIINRGYTGVKVALDDVMSNEAHLIFLARLNVDIIKIDRMFAERILAPDWPTAEDKLFLQLCRDSHRSVVVEGVEHAVQANVLREAGVQFAQGWYFSRAVPAEEFKAFYAKRNAAKMPVA